MDRDKKRSFLLYKLVVFSYHGLDQDEEQFLQTYANNIHAVIEDMNWVMDFYFKNKDNLLKKSLEMGDTFLSDTDRDIIKDNIFSTYQELFTKGHVTEAEALALLRIAKRWGLTKDLLELYKQEKTI